MNAASDWPSRARQQTCTYDCSTRAPGPESFGGARSMMTADPHVAPSANAVACSCAPGPQPGGYSTVKSREAGAVVPVVPPVVGVVGAGPVVLDCGPGVVLDCGTGVVEDAGAGIDVDVDVGSSPRETDALSASPQPTSATLPNTAATPSTTLRFVISQPRRTF